MLTDNQIKWALKYAEYLDKTDGFLGLILVALNNDLFPDTEPVFDGKDVVTVLEIVNYMSDKLLIERVKSEISMLEVKQ